MNHLTWTYGPMTDEHLVSYMLQKIQMTYGSKWDAKFGTEVCNLISFAHNWVR